MIQNEGETDRVIRVVTGAVLFLVAFSVTTGVLEVVLFVVSGVLIATGIFGFCPIYKVIGISTKK